MHAYLIGDIPNEFKGIRLETCTNSSSVLSKEQYPTYCRTLGLSPAIRIFEGRSIRVIGGRKTSIGTAVIQIPFKSFCLVIDFDFLLVADQVPKLLIMRRMIRNGLDISIQQAHVTHGLKKQRLKLDKYFLIHEWSPKTCISPYTKRNRSAASTGTSGIPLSDPRPAFYEEQHRGSRPET